MVKTQTALLIGGAVLLYLLSKRRAGMMLVSGVPVTQGPSSLGLAPRGVGGGAVPNYFEPYGGDVAPAWSPPPNNIGVAPLAGNVTMGSGPGGAFTITDISLLARQLDWAKQNFGMGVTINDISTLAAQLDYARRNFGVQVFTPVRGGISSSLAGPVAVMADDMYLASAGRPASRGIGAPMMGRGW